MDRRLEHSWLSHPFPGRLFGWWVRASKAEPTSTAMHRCSVLLELDIFSSTCRENTSSPAVSTIICLETDDYVGSDLKALALENTGKMCTSLELSSADLSLGFSGAIRCYRKWKRNWERRGFYWVAFPWTRRTRSDRTELAENSFSSRGRGCPGVSLAMMIECELAPLVISGELRKRCTGWLKRWDPGPLLGAAERRLFVLLLQRAQHSLEARSCRRETWMSSRAVRFGSSGRSWRCLAERSWSDGFSCSSQTGACSV